MLLFAGLAHGKYLAAECLLAVLILLCFPAGLPTAAQSFHKGKALQRVSMYIHVMQLTKTCCAMALLAVPCACMQSRVSFHGLLLVARRSSPARGVPCARPRAKE